MKSAKPREAGTGRSPSAAAAEQLDALREAIEASSDDLRRGIEVLIWRFSGQLQLPRGREEVAALAEEVLQEAVARALSRPEHYDPTRSAHAWLLGFALNVLRELRRRRMVEMQRLQPLPQPDADDGEPHSEEILGKVYQMATTQPVLLMELLDLVPPKHRQVLIYRFVNDLQGRELAAILGVSEGAARVRLSRAVAMLAAEYHRAEQAGEGDQ